MAKGRPLKIAWSESEEELYQLYLTEAIGVRKQKSQFFWLVKSGRTIREASCIVGIQERVGQRYIGWYKKEGLKAALNRCHGGDRGKNQSRLSQEEEEKLKQAANEGKLKTVWQGITWVQEKFNVSYTYEGMRSVFKRLKLKKKVPRKQHIKSDPEVQKEWKKGA